jgi:hypothetical protein
MKTILFVLTLSQVLLGKPMHPHHSMEGDSTEMEMPDSDPRGKIFFVPSDCGEGEVWDSITTMCFPVAKGAPMTHLMVHGNAFLVAITETSPRGSTNIAAPNMEMANLGRTVGERHFLNVGLMLTFEKWTFPENGYPLLLQVGEENAQGLPYIDAQHPHSSPIMGLTFSDTIRLGEGKDFLKFFFAPRGQSTDGPIAFMHRPTGVVNPDAPLGHHIGQDVGHISSTVVGASLRLGGTTLEASGFNGTEPQPTRVDLPIGTPNSVAVRAIQFISDDFFAMASAAYVQNPEAGVTQNMRYSASVYGKTLGVGTGTLYQTLIFGVLRSYGGDALRYSTGYEFSLLFPERNVWGRLEVLQRAPEDLALSTLPNQDDGRWVGALTLGFTQTLKDFGFGKLQAGISGTAYWLPAEYHSDYAGNPFAAKIFLQASGMEMWML